MKLTRQWKFVVLLLALIIIPSVLLAYFSVLAIEAERVAYEQRIRESYQRLAQFGIVTLSQRFEDFSDRWITALQPLQLLNMSDEHQEITLNQLVEEEPLVDAAYLINSRGQLLFPATFEQQRLPSFQADEQVPTGHWLQRFESLSENAEQWEFERSSPDSALAIFEQVVDRFPVPQLRAVALNEIARIHLYQARWEGAYRTYRKLVEEYPHARDLNNLHLRFYAKFQLVSVQENLQQLDQAMPQLLALYQDLLDHSDEVNRVQFEFFLEKIQISFTRLIGAFSPAQQQTFRQLYSKLHERKKKSIGESYLIEKLYQRLGRSILKRDPYRPRFKYLSDFAVEQPYLVAYLLLAERENVMVRSALGLEINLEALKQELFPQIISEGNYPDDVVIAILDEKNKFILGEADKIVSEPAAIQQLSDPLDFWQLALFPSLANPLLSGGDSWLYSKLWGIFLLWLAILVGAGVVLYNWRKQRRLSLQKTTFISSVTHELKTPLTSIQMYSGFLAKNEHLKDDVEAQQHVKIIRSESNRLSQLVDNVLDFAKIERGSKRYRFEYEEPEAIIRQVVDVFRFQYDVHSVPIELHLESPLPEIYVDRQAISQALMNLISNAIKYSPDKQSVSVSAIQNGKYINVAVQDRGIGIRHKDQKRIFENYFRVNDKKAEHIAGTGLGLPLVKRIAEAHNGGIRVESDQGKGATFTLRLPFEQPLTSED